MKRISVLIADDELAARERLERLLEADSSFIIKKTCSNGSEVLETLQETEIDLLLLDIEMPGISGLEVISKLTASKRPYVAFITAFDEYAVQAFEYYALDYLLKPFTNERFQQTLTRVKERFRNDQASNFPWAGMVDFVKTGQLPGNRIAVKTGKKYHFIHPDEISYICANGNYCEIWLPGGRKFLHRETISHLLSLLPPGKFARIHQSYIISTSAVREVKRAAFAEMEVTMNDGRALKVSRKYKDVVRQMIR